MWTLRLDGRRGCRHFATRDEAWVYVLSRWPSAYADGLAHVVEDFAMLLNRDAMGPYRFGTLAADGPDQPQLAARAAATSPRRTVGCPIRATN